MPVGALFGHPQVSQLIVGIDEGDALGPQFGHQTRRLDETSGQPDPLATEQIVTFGLWEFVVVDDRVAEQASGDRLAEA